MQALLGLAALRARKGTPGVQRGENKRYHQPDGLEGARREEPNPQSGIHPWLPLTTLVRVSHLLPHPSYLRKRCKPAVVAAFLRGSNKPGRGS
jgi:hypothetical protein